LDLAASAHYIQHGFSQVYQSHLMKSMKRNLLHKMQMVDMSQSLHVSIQEIAAMKTFVEFDDHITAILHGFTDAKDYYQQCSALGDLPLIKKPTLILHAQDDPFMDDKVIPSAALINQHVAYELSAHGGHVGFLISLTGPNNCWLAQRIPQFLSEFV
jgi:predicted alpha/beta-fold hydrolase